MSRIGKAPIQIPADVTVAVDANVLSVKGPKGELSFTVPHGVSVKHHESRLDILRSADDTASRALHGFVRAELSNYVEGVTKGWSKQLELSGVGYRVALSGTNLVLNIGFSHPVNITPPSGITFAVNEGKIVVSGVNKHQVGQVAASIREIKKPEPYKGKGIKYVGEYIRKKAGKAKAVGGAPGAK